MIEVIMWTSDICQWLTQDWASNHPAWVNNNTVNLVNFCSSNVWRDHQVPILAVWIIQLAYPIPGWNAQSGNTTHDPASSWVAVFYQNWISQPPVLTGLTTFFGGGAPDLSTAVTGTSEPAALCFPDWKTFRVFPLFAQIFSCRDYNRWHHKMVSNRTQTTIWAVIVS